MMFWVFLLITFAFIVGGLLNVQPSAMQKRIASLRSSAFDYHLHVKLPVSLSFPAGCVKSEHAYYCKQLKLKHRQPFVHLLKDVNSNVQAVPIKKSKQVDALREILIAIPHEYNALYVGNGLIGISWSEESGDSVPDELLNAVQKIENLLLA